MPKCPFAEWRPITGNVGPYISGPFRIVHHTTEGYRAEDAFSAYAKNRSDPHFTVDEHGVYQHIDTAMCARSLRNRKGGVQTNKQSAVQIEIVGFAHKPKSIRTLANVARLCRWIEDVHGVPLVWPHGPVKTATDQGKDPGNHNRDAKTWVTDGGHYGHSQVPENTHWDPAFTRDETAFLMEAEFDDFGELRFADRMTVFVERLAADEDLSDAVSTMPDHHHVDGSADGEDEYDLY